VETLKLTKLEVFSYSYLGKLAFNFLSKDAGTYKLTSLSIFSEYLKSDHVYLGS